MSFREVPVFEVREVLRLGVGGEGLGSIERLSPVDRKTVRRYVEAAGECGVVQNGDEAQLSDEVIGWVCGRVRPHRRDGHGRSWDALCADHDRLKGWLVDDKLTVVKPTSCSPAR